MEVPKHVKMGAREHKTSSQEIEPFVLLLFYYKAV